MARQARQQQLVQSVARSLEILETLAGHEDLGLGEIAVRTHLQPSTVHRLLVTLIARGYAVRTQPGGRYALGHKPAELAGAAGRRTERLRTLARPHLGAIRERTGESANLSILAPPNSVYIDHVDGTRAVRMLAPIGAAVPAHASAAGKAMLAFAPSPMVAALVGGEPLASLTPATITTLATLDRELARIRACGYALDDEEHEPGVGCVAAPIFDRQGNAVAALSVSAPTQRVRDSDPAALGLLLVEQARVISQAMGDESA